MVIGSATILSVTFASAQTDAGPKALNPAEKWVAGEVTAGKPADLRQQFPAEKDRKLGAEFLTNLLTGKLPGVTIQSPGVRILGATFDEPVDLGNAEIPCEVWLDYCQFNGKASFARASFGENASFAFATFKQGAIFDATKIEQTAIFHGTVFEGDASFKNAIINGDFFAGGAQFKDTNLGAVFNAMTVGHLAGFDGASFEGPAYFEQADIGGDFEAAGAGFHDKRQGVDFACMKVGQIAKFDDAIFEGPVNFGAADIGGFFSASKAQFHDKEQGAFFGTMKVGQVANFDNALFQGPVNFTAADFEGNFRAVGARFEDTRKGATLMGTKFAQFAIFDNALFQGPADFSEADIAGEFWAHNVRFQDTGKGTNFRGMKAGDEAIFEGAVFNGSVDFSAADVTGNFDMYGAQFTSTTGTAQFGMDCDRKGIFSPTTFAGTVSFADSNFFDLIVSGTDGAAPVPQLDLTRASVKGYLTVWDIGVHTLTAGSLKVEGPADLTAITVDGTADLSDGTFTTLDLSLSSWPHGAGAFHMQDMDYQCLRRYPSRPLNESESHAELLKLADQSAFAADVYGNLEAFFLRQGYGEDADNAFIAGKRRERREAFQRGEYGRWLGSLALDLLVGYGRRPWYAEIESAIVVATGCFLFSAEKMEPENKHESARGYNPFWYSLGLFLPGVDLQAEKVWKPKQEHVFLRNYKHVQILLGWILVPIVLIALTGLIK